MWLDFMGGQKLFQRGNRLRQENTILYAAPCHWMLARKYEVSSLLSNSLADEASAPSSGRCASTCTCIFMLTILWSYVLTLLYFWQVNHKSKLKNCHIITTGYPPPTTIVFTGSLPISSLRVKEWCLLIFYDMSVIMFHI